MARAQAHLVAGRYPQAIGAFRAALGLDPSTMDAYLGMAEALTAQGRHEDAVYELVEAAEASMARDAPDAAMGLYGQAMAIDPSRLDLHLDVAFVEKAIGEHEAAMVRVESLAENYMNEGRTDEAAELMRFVATWGEEDEVEAARDPLWDTTPTHTALISGETVIVRNPLLPELGVPTASLAAPIVSEAARADVVTPPELAAPAPEVAALEVDLDPGLLGVADDPELDMVTQVARAPLPPLNAEPTDTRVETTGDAEPDLETIVHFAMLQLESFEPVKPNTTVAAVEPRPSPRRAATRETPARPTSTASLGQGKFRLTRAPRPDGPKPKTAPSRANPTAASQVRRPGARMEAARPDASRRPGVRTEPARPDASRRPVAATGPARTKAPRRSLAATGPTRAATPRRPLATTGSARPSASRRTATRPTPANHAANNPANNPVVERLRARAGLGDAPTGPRGVRSRPTTPIAVRPAIRTRPEGEEDVTMRFRRPRGTGPAAH